MGLIYKFQPTAVHVLPECLVKRVRTHSALFDERSDFSFPAGSRGLFRSRWSEGFWGVDLSARTCSGMQKWECLNKLLSTARRIGSCSNRVTSSELGLFFAANHMCV